MKQISVAQAKNHLSELLARVGAGKEIAVTRYGKPVARLGALERESDPQAQRAKVQAVFQQLAPLRRGVRLEGDLKSIAHHGLE